MARSPAAVPPGRPADEALLSAASRGCLAEVQAALQAGADPDVRDVCGDTPLLRAARGGHSGCCRALLQHGTDVAAQGSGGATAVTIAVQLGCPQLLDTVLTPAAGLTARTDRGLSAFQLTCLGSRPPSMLQRLLRHYREQLADVPGSHSCCNAQPGRDAVEAGWPLVLALYAAVAASAASCLQLLAEDPLARCAYAAQFGGVTEPLPTASRQLDDDCLLCTARLAAEGKPAGDSSQDDGAHASSPLALVPAAAEGDGPHLLAAEGLASDAGLQAESSPAAPLPQPQPRPTANLPAAARPLCAADGDWLQQELGFLLDDEVVGPDNALSASFVWQTSGLPCHLAAALNQPDCLRVLFAAGLGCPDQPGAEGFTLLMLAAAANAAAAAAVLLQAGAALEARNAAGRTALFLAAVSGSPATLALLVKAGADANAAEGQRLVSPLAAAVTRAAAAEAGRSPRAASLRRCVQQLLEAGADPNRAAQDGSTPLHAAAAGGSVACLDALLAAGAELEATDGAGRTPLAAAAAGRAPSPCCVLALLARGAEVASEELAARVLDCLVEGSTSGVPGSAATADAAQAVGEDRGGNPPSVWRLLASLNVRQLRALTTRCSFFDLPLADGPPVALGATAVDAMLELVAEGCANLLYNVSAADNAAQGRRLARLLDLLRRAAAGDGSDGCGTGGYSAVRDAVEASGHVGRLRGMWASAGMLLQYAACIMRCGGVPPGDRALLACRVGHLFAAYHGLARLLAALGLSLTAAVARPNVPLREAAAQSLCNPAGSAPGVASPALPPTPAVYGSCGAKDAAAARSASQGEEEPAMSAALRPYGDEIDRLLACIADEEQVSGWHFVLEYQQVASLASRQRLLQSLAAVGQRRRERALPLSTGRSDVLQRACTAVDDAGAAAELAAGGPARMAGDSLWHGVRVSFDGEDGSGDGVQREWFSLLAADLADPQAGLFESHDGGASHTPAPHASLQCDCPPERAIGWDGSSGGSSPPGCHLRKFELVGALMGLALLQGHTLPGFRLAPAAWRLVLGQPPQPEADLAAADPQLHRSLQLLRGMGPAAEDLGLYFEAHDGLGRATELVPGGAALAVTEANVERYIEALARYKSVQCMASPCAAMGRGLRRVMTPASVDALARCFSHCEANALLAGRAELDAAEWREHARLEGCTPHTPQLVWLWSAVEHWEQPQRAALLAFATGSPALPAGGFAALRGFNGAQHPFTVSLVSSEGDGRLPRAATCFNTLFLPCYSCPAVLEARLGQALAANHVFDEAVIRR